jgi:hypothetical protein
MKPRTNRGIERRTVEVTSTSPRAEAAERSTMSGSIMALRVSFTTVATVRATGPNAAAVAMT